MQSFKRLRGSMFALLRQVNVGNRAHIYTAAHASIYAANAQAGAALAGALRSTRVLAAFLASSGASAHAGCSRQCRYNCF